MVVLVLGGSGQLGRCLRDQLVGTDFNVIFTSRSEIDLMAGSELYGKIAAINPNVIVNAAAYTLVDQAENDFETANAINNIAVLNLASICESIGCWLIHVSTDYVFDGMSLTPYVESDLTNPLTVYGKTKLDGEKAIEASGCQFNIIRTSWVFSEYGSNFLKTMLKLGAERDNLSIVSDQIGSPTYCHDIANLIRLIILERQSENMISGILHFAGDSSCSWYEFAQAIFSEAKKFGRKVPSSISPISGEFFPTLAKRPLFSVLNCSKIVSQLNIQPSCWRLGVTESLRKLTSR
jgi:dTDP-4-dehydrorhamnose reductase